MEKDAESWLLDGNSGEYSAQYDIKDHPVLEKNHSFSAILTTGCKLKRGKT
ncbi:MAG: hypothetical protein HKP55_01425 [Gammaproteobacteria bacterium]|nr:hypothetical protein [Gammaproteobacteria bacterium]NNJ90309.1 hypothetical protein [Gammaproteobacteria bacterium]